MQHRLWSMGFVAALLTACGGGGSSNSGSGGPPVNTPPVDRLALTWVGPVGVSASANSLPLELTLTNSSTAAAQNVQLSLTFGTGVGAQPVFFDCSANSFATCPGGSSFPVTVTSLPANGSLRFIVHVSSAAGFSGTVRATVNATSANDEVTTNNAAQIDMPVYTSDVGVAVSTPATDLVGGDTVPFTMTVSNAGPDATKDVRIVSQFGGRQTQSDLTCAATGGATCPAALSTDMTVPTIPNGGTLTFSRNALVGMDALASVSATMRVELYADQNFANNEQSASAYVQVPATSSSPTFLKFESDTGDIVGGGQDRSYNRTNAVFGLQDYGDYISFGIVGNESWRADFHKAAGQARWQPGTVIDLLGAPFHDPATGGLNISGSSGCQHNGWFKILDVTYNGDDLATFDVIFAQHCEGRAPAIRGQIHWVANDGTRPPGPVNPAPANLWRPSPLDLPASGNFVYLQGDIGDHILPGATETWTQANAVFSVQQTNGSLGITSNGAANYGLSFRAMAPITQMEPGYYEIDPGAPFWNPTFPAMNVSGNGRQCNDAVGGWYVIENVAYNNGEIIALDMRFLQQCGNRVGVLRGQVHWRSDDPSQPAGPVVPVPGGLWTPPASVPATGNVFYVEGVPVTMSETYTPLDSVMLVDYGSPPVGGRFHFDVSGARFWSADLQAMSSLPDIVAGYYGNLGAYPNHNPVIGGIKIAGPWTCANGSGWIAVDSITRTGNAISSIELRFEQNCTGLAQPMHGFIRWAVTDTRTPLGPQPAPANLWEPAPGTTPASGNYVYLLSEPESGPAQTFTYTQASAEFVAYTHGNVFEFATNGDERWAGQFVPMIPLQELQPGYYDMTNGANAATAQFSWLRYLDQPCNVTTGWFMIDEVTYQNGIVRTIDARFERRCLNSAANVRGEIHWRFDDTTAAPGPVAPPVGLWEPEPGEVPAVGNVFYAIGEIGSVIADGDTILLTAPSSVFQGGTGIDTFFVGAAPLNETGLSLHLDSMNSIPRLQPGYYANTGATSLGNPTRGQIDFAARSFSCGYGSTGWFLIESVTYDGEQMTSLNARFEYRCGPTAPAARGVVRWTQ